MITPATTAANKALKKRLVLILFPPLAYLIVRWDGKAGSELKARKQQYLCIEKRYKPLQRSQQGQARPHPTWRREYRSEERRVGKESRTRARTNEKRATA